MAETPEQLAARLKRQAMRDHAFVGNGEYCEGWNAPVSYSSETATITMRSGCGYPRSLHPSPEGE